MGKPKEFKMPKGKILMGKRPKPGPVKPTPAWKKRQQLASNRKIEDNSQKGFGAEPGGKTQMQKPKKSATTTARRPQLDKMANGAGGYNKTLSMPGGRAAGNNRPQLDKMSPGTGEVRRRSYDADMVGVAPRYNADNDRPSYYSGSFYDRKNATEIGRKKEFNRHNAELRARQTPGRRRRGVGK